MSKRGAQKGSEQKSHRSPSLQVVRKAPRLRIQYPVFCGTEMQRWGPQVWHNFGISTLQPSSCWKWMRGTPPPGGSVVVSGWHGSSLQPKTRFSRRALEEKSPIGCSASGFLMWRSSHAICLPGLPFFSRHRKPRPGSTKSSPKFNEPGRAQGT